MGGRAIFYNFDQKLKILQNMPYHSFSDFVFGTKELRYPLFGQRPEGADDLCFYTYAFTPML